MNKYIWGAIGAWVVVVFVYMAQFAVSPISDSPDAWGQLGDYLGGVINPIFGFITIVLLIQSLKLQNQSNVNLINQINDSKKNEKSKNFENLFFNLIEVKRSYFTDFKVEFILEGDKKIFTRDVAVDKLESIIQSLKSVGKKDSEIKDFLDDVNKRNNIFSQIRCFYVIVRLIDERLIESEGFEKKDRISYYKLLINFTEFSHLRLVIMAMQFLDYESTKYLNKNIEFKQVLKELNLTINPY